MIAYSGGQLAVVNAVERSGLISYDEDSGGDAFWRDDARYMPHNLFVNTAKLRAKSAKADRGRGTAAPAVPVRRGRAGGWQARLAGLRGVLVLRGRHVEVGQGRRRWQRMLDGAPMTLDTGTPITAANVIIQQVVVTEGDLVDVLGYHSPEVDGDRHRQGVDPAGRRDDRRAPGAGPVMGAVTKFVTKTGEIIPLAPGNTWVELVAKGTPPTVTK